MSFHLCGDAGQLPDVGQARFQLYSATQKLYPVADSYVHKQHSSSNYGSANSLQLRGPDGFQRIAYLKFDLSVLPPGAYVTSAKVYLCLFDGDSSTENVDASFVSSDSWTEYGITWDNKPAYSATPTSSTPVAGPSYSGIGDWYNWIVTSDVASEYAGDKVLSLAFTLRNAYEQKYFHSKEYYDTSGDPYLEVTYVTLDHFHVYVTPSTVQAGQQFSVTVVAKDDANVTIPAWTGTVALSAVLASNPDSPGGGTLGITSVAITSGGGVTITTETYTKAEAIKIKATGGSITGLSNPVTFIAGNAYKIEYISGNGQSQAVATALTSPFVARVTDQYGNPVSGRTVAWAATSFPTGATGQSLSVTSGPTDTSGLASSTLTLGTKTGSYQVSASSAGLVGSPLLFNAAAISGTLHHIVVTPNPKTVVVGHAQSFVATSYDLYNNTIPGVTYIWTTNVGTMNNEGVLTAQTLAPATGYARATNGTVQGDATVCVIPEVASELLLIPESANMTAGDQYSWFTVQTSDQYGNAALVSSDLIVQLAVDSPTGKFRPVGSGTNITQVTILAGQNSTRFDYFDVTAGLYTVAVNAAGLSSDFSMVEVNAAPPQRFVFTYITSPKIAGVSFSITVHAEDRYGNIVASYAGKATLTDMTGTISPTLTDNFAAGIWTGNVTITKVQVEVTITATDGPISDTSDKFDVVHGEAKHITVTPDPETVESGGDVICTATADDGFGNYWNVTSSTVFTIVEVEHGGIWAGRVYTSYGLGTWTIKGSYDTLTDDATLTVIGGLLNVMKSGPGVVQPGQTFNYTVVIQNNGAGTAKEIVLIDRIPSQLMYVLSSPTGAYFPANQTVKWRLPDVAPGASFSVSVAVQVLPNTPDSTVIQNAVSVDWSQRKQAYGPSPLTSNVTTTVHKVVIQLEFSKTANTTLAVPGDTVAFTISLKNTSPLNSTPARDIVVTDTLPSPLQPVSSNPLATTSIGANGETVLAWTLPSLAPGSTYTVTYTVQAERVLERTTVHNTAMFSAYSQDGRDHYTGTQMATLIIGVPEIVITKTSSMNSACPGDTVPFTIAVVNNGQSPALDVSVEEHIPAEMEFVSASGQYSLNQSIGVIGWTVSRLDPAQSASFTISLCIRTDVGGGITITDEAASRWQDRNQNGYGPVFSHYTLTTRGPADLRIKNRVNPSTGVRPGSVVNFILEVTNVGEGIAKRIIVTDLLPTGLTYQTGSSYLLLPDNMASSVTPEVLANGSLRWSISANLLPGNRLNITFAARVSETARGPLHNVAVANSTYDEVIVPLIVPSIITTKTSDVGQVERGGEIVYTIQLYNAGNDTATTITVQDRPSTSLQYVVGSSTLGGQPIGDPRQDDRTLTWQLAVPLAPGQRLALSFSTLVSSWATGPIVNSAKITYDGNSAEVLSDPVEILVPNLVASNRADVGTVTVGGNVTFTVVITNVGNGTAYGVTITDPLPSNLDYPAGSSTLNGTAFSDPRVQAGSELVWDVVGALQPGQTIVLSFTTIARSTGQASMAENVVRVDWKDGGGNEDHVLTQEIYLSLRQMVTSIVVLLLAAGPVMMLVGRRSRIVLSDEPLMFLVSTGTIGHLGGLYNQIWVAPIVAGTTRQRLSAEGAENLDRLIRERTILISPREEITEAPGLSNEDACSLVVAAEQGAELCLTSSEALMTASGLGIVTKELAVLVGQMYLRGLISNIALQELTTRLHEFRGRRWHSPTS